MEMNEYMAPVLASDREVDGTAVDGKLRMYVLVESSAVFGKGLAR